MKVFKTYTIALFLLSIIVSCVPGGGNYNDGPSNLEVATIFGDKMVLQRGVEIPVWGKAFKTTKIQVVFNNVEVETSSDKNGNWKVLLPVQKAGGPYELEIIANDTIIVLKDILVGEVWLASGQSNMHLNMNRTLNGEENARKANNPNIRLYYMKPTFPTGKNGVHTNEELKILNDNKYFINEGWKKADSTSVKYFSAVAYYFSEKLQGELNVPIGIIHNAVPGSSIELWMSPELIASDTLVANFAEQRWIPADTTNKEMLISIAYKQISKSDSVGQKHPWMPSYYYINGILPINNFAIKGVIWYQGESNGEQPELYSKMFKEMISSWRKDWGYEFPLYYVQLTSRADRESWIEFRNMQREVLDSIPNSGMVVISDVGDKYDTHAKNKKPVGERLAKLALGKTYGVGVNYESPMFDKVIVENGKAIISFKGQFAKLQTNDNKDVRGFEIYAGELGYIDFKAKIVGKTIEIEIPPGIEKVSVRYAWKSFTDANLESGNGMPVSTFMSK